MTIRNLTTKWYFVTKIVLIYREKKFSIHLEKHLKFVANGREFAKILESLEQFIQTLKGKNNFWNRILFELVPGGFTDLVDHDSNWKKILGFRNLQENLKKVSVYLLSLVFFNVGSSFILQVHISHLQLMKNIWIFLSLQRMFYEFPDQCFHLFFVKQDVTNSYSQISNFQDSFY